MACREEGVAFMINKQTTPKTKSELVSAIQRLTNPKFEVIEIVDESSYRQGVRSLDTFKRRGSVSIILIQH
jgi:ABC-type multidrug transport system fused ATPase/permease subunit